MAFELWTDGITLVDRVARLFNKRYVARDPLSGVVDSVNTIFYANYPPILSSGSMGVYTTGSAPLASSAYTVDSDFGALYFNTAPSVQPVASYSTAKYSDLTVRSLLVAGFDEMEGLWFRGYSLSTTVGSIVPITESSATAYVVDTSGSDPVIGSVYFSTSRNQLNLYAKCVQLAFYRTLMGEHALSDFIWKEAQGLSIDKSMTVRNLKIAYDSLWDTLKKVLEQAQVEQLGDGLYGGAIAPQMTREFVAHRFWQKVAAAEDWTGTTPYRGTTW